MITVANLVTAFHDIDALKGRVCGKCQHGLVVKCWRDQVHCRNGYKPAGQDDGCGDWQPKPDRAKALAAVVMSI
jgi:hypothetical protein